MSKIRDISNMIFGRLIALKVNGKDSTNKTLWLCVCECGNKTNATMLNLVKGVTRSCGCIKHQPSKKRHDLINKKFGKLTAISVYDKLKWRCICECGNFINVRTVHLTHNHTKSCGCIIGLKETEFYKKKRLRNSSSKWARQIVKESDCKCNACGRREKIQAHHIMPFSLYPSLITNIENGAALCIDCHKNVHKLISSGIECGDALAIIISKFNFENNVIKYIARDKGGVEDLKKARHYLDKLIEESNV